MKIKNRMLAGFCVARSTPGIFDPIRDKDGKVAKLHVLGPRRTRKVVQRIAAQRAAAAAAK